MIISLEFVCKFTPRGTRHGHVSVRTHELVRFILDLTENPTKDIMRRSAKSYSTHCEDGMTPKTQYLGGLLVMQCWNSPQQIYLIVPTAQIDSPAGLESTYVQSTDRVDTRVIWVALEAPNKLIRIP